MTHFDVYVTSDEQTAIGHMSMMSVFPFFLMCKVSYCMSLVLRSPGEKMCIPDSG